MMDEQGGMETPAPESGGLQPAPTVDFNGMAGDFFLMQMGNFLLSVITLGIYRFWGKAKYRRYLWGHATLDGDALEYTGTGFELFVGAILVILLVSIPFGLLSVLLPLLIADKAVAIFLTQFILIVAIYYLVGVGQYRSWRYLLSRTSWRGIRSGMVEEGFSYGVFSFGLTMASLFSLGLATPWAMAKRWNRLVQDVRIGSLPMRAEAQPDLLWKPFLIAWGVVMVPLAAFGVWFFLNFGAAFGKPEPSPADAEQLLIAIVVLYLGLLILGFVAAMFFANYQSVYLRETFGKTWIGDGMRLRLEATAWEVIRYYLFNILLAMIPFGSLLYPFRYWNFMAQRIRIDGSYDEAALQQSSLAAPTQGDGLVDAFDASSF